MLTVQSFQGKRPTYCNSAVLGCADSLYWEFEHGSQYGDPNVTVSPGYLDKPYIGGLLIALLVLNRERGPIRGIM